MNRMLMLALGVALALGATRARAEDAPFEVSPLASRSLAARGPIALSAAVEPGSFHWAIESGFPFGTARRDATGRLQQPMGPWRLDAFVNAVHDREQATTLAGVGYALRLEHAREKTAAWLGVSQSGAGAPGLRLGAGLAHVFSGVHAEVEWVASGAMNDPRWSVTRHFQYGSDHDSTSMLRDTSVTDPAALWNTAQGTLRWRMGRLSLSSVGGVSISDGVRARSWGQGMVEWQLTRRMLLLGSLGERPAPSLAFHSDAHPRSMVGIQFAPWSAPGWAMSGSLQPTAVAWRTEVRPYDQLLVKVRLRDVAAAEIAGDFTDWKPVKLEPLHGGWWQQVLSVSPGVHRVQLRLNGGPWHCPPGLPRADDGPGGPSGTLVVLPGAD